MDIASAFPCRINEQIINSASNVSR